MGIQQSKVSLKVSEKILLQMDDIERAVSPFVENENKSAVLRICVSVTHALIFTPGGASDILRALQTLARMNKGKARTEQETLALRRKIEAAQERLRMRE